MATHLFHCRRLNGKFPGNIREYADDALEIELVDQPLSADFCAELARFGGAYDERHAHTPEEIANFVAVWAGESRDWAFRIRGELRGVVQIGFMPNDERRRRCWCSARWMDDIPVETVRDVCREALAWAEVPGQAEALAHVYEDRTETIALWLSLGFRQIGLERFLQRDLRVLPRPPLIDLEGIEVTTLAQRPDLMQDTFAVYREGLLSIPGEDEAGIPDFSTWSEGIATSPSSPAASRYIAIESGEVVGYCSLNFPRARPTVAEHGMLAVRPDRRARGIGRMFKHLAIHIAADAGCERIETDNNAENAAILRMNTSLGYVDMPAMVKLSLGRR